MKSLIEQNREAVKQATATHTLASRRKAELSRKRHKNQSIACVVGDISGSMGGTKMFELRRCYTEIWRPDLRALVFSSEVYELESQADIATLREQSSTDMLAALNEAWLTPGVKQIVLMTDGYPNGGPDRILQEAMAHRDVPIDTVGIGDQGIMDFRPEFLRELSRLTGGRYYDCSEPVHLTSTVTALLDSPPMSQIGTSSTEHGGGVIKL